MEDELRVGEVVVRLGENKSKVVRKRAPAEDNNQYLGVKELHPAELEASGTGEDACLFDEESDEVNSHNDIVVEHDALEASHQVDMFVEKFANGLEEEDCVALKEFADEHTLNQSTSSINKDDHVKEVVPNQKSPSVEEDPPMDEAVICHNSSQEDRAGIIVHDDPIMLTEGWANKPQESSAAPK
ncbi:hypothetical protein TSUD_214440 [Trifolium subterraneum]|uniref:Uncharacterized protein n=1 Tax=Trifolium subterraneum TaxID=3900 RepID=A0A2Z6P1D4_TRISU|nr:hypothetical protein TSUD_214440 [Trifolium subterraneum]